MKILGIHIGHDSSAALVINGKIIADVAEERFKRIKHYSGFPIQAIDFCLQQGNIKPEELDIIAIPTSVARPELNYFLNLSGSQIEKQKNINRIAKYINKVSGRTQNCPPPYTKRFPVGKKTHIVHIDHHLAHAATAYFTSGLNSKCLVITCDGIGDGVSLAIWRGENGDIKELQKFYVNGSLGFFYSNVTVALGWWHGDGEGKTMGLAPYGDPHKALNEMVQFSPKYENGNLSSPYDFGTPNLWSEKGTFHFHLEDSKKIHSLLKKYRREEISAAAQLILEQQIMNIIIPWLEKEKTKNLACSGGVFLNVKLNQRLWNSRKIDNHYIFPNAGDSGLAIGAALMADRTANPRKEIDKITHLYLGPEYSNKEIEHILKLNNLSYKYDENPSEIGAEHLAKGKIIAWFQGRMESGPRALGNRSILMSANIAENKDILNARVKFREAFRPFCPSLITEKKAEYFKHHRDERFMITSFDVQETKKGKIPAVVHVDGTLRPQTVEKDINPRYWNLISHFGKLTGESVVLNTSFNIMGEPIICHPRQAIRCFFDSGIDELILGNFNISKNTT